MNQNGFSPVVVVLGIVIVFSFVGGAYYLGIKKDQVVTVSEVVQLSPVPVSTPPVSSVSANPKNDLDVAWNTYTDITDYGSGRYSIEYPSSWEQNTEYDSKNMFYPLGKDKKEFAASFGIGGSGISLSTCKDRIYPAGKAKYCIFNTEQGIFHYVVFDDDKTTYIFRLGYIPHEYDKEYEKIFSRMLASFKKLKD